MKNILSPRDTKYTVGWREGACANSGKSRLKCAYSGPSFISSRDPRGTGRSLLVSAHAAFAFPHLRLSYIYVRQLYTDDILSDHKRACDDAVCDHETILATHYNFNTILSTRTAFSRIVFKWYYYYYYLLLLTNPSMSSTEYYSLYIFGFGHYYLCSGAYVCYI